MGRKTERKYKLTRRKRFMWAYGLWCSMIAAVITYTRCFKEDFTKETKEKIYVTLGILTVLFTALTILFG